MRLNWGMTIVVGIGLLLLVVGWQGTHDKIWRIISLQNQTPQATHCPQNTYISTTGKCPGQCTMDTVAGQVCVPKVA